MAFPSSSLYAANLMAGWNATASDIDIDTHQMVAALYGGGGDTMAQDPLSNTPVGYSATGEQTNVSGTGYVAGGANMGAFTYTCNGTLIVASCASDTSWALATLTNVIGVVVYDTDATSPVANACLVAVKFGSPGSSGGGTFTIDWAASPTTNTIFTIDPMP